MGDVKWTIFGLTRNRSFKKVAALGDMWRDVATVPSTFSYAKVAFLVSAVRMRRRISVRSVGLARVGSRDPNNDPVFGSGSGASRCHRSLVISSC